MASDVIWRYMDLAKYISLLERGLFFTRASEFGDLWEGSWAEYDIRDFHEQNLGQSCDEINARWTERYQAKVASLSQFGVSCWHFSDHESAALWELYIHQGLGVAVQSTVDRVQEALTGNAREIVSRPITYIDYCGRALGDDPLDLLSHKRSEFAFERELRFFIKLRPDEIEAIKSMIWARNSGGKRYLPVNRDSLLILHGPTYASTDKTVDRRTAPVGIHLHTDLGKLIQKVYLAPRTSWHVRRAVLAVTEVFGLPRTLVAEPQMDLNPFDVLEFSDSYPKYWRET